MFVSIFSITIGLVSAILIGCCLSWYYFRYKSIRQFCQKLHLKIALYWYYIVLGCVLLYILTNFNSCKDLHFTSEFNGDNLIFVFGIALSILPFFKSFKGFGIDVEINNQISNIEADFEKKIETAKHKTDNIKHHEQRNTKCYK